MQILHYIYFYGIIYDYTLLYYWNFPIERISIFYSLLWETTHKLRNHVCPIQYNIYLLFSFFFKKIDLLSLSNTFSSSVIKLTKTWTAPSVPKNSMSPITSPFFAPCIHALKPHAELAIKPSSVAITSLFRSASSATLTSLILSFNTSDSPSSSF